MATQGIQGNFLYRRLTAYLRVTRGKVVVWGVFLFPYLCTAVLFSGITPRWVQVFVYKTTTYIQEVLPSPLPKKERVVTATAADFEQLTLCYFLLTYLWSCIVVESFGIISGSKRAYKKKGSKRK